MTTSKELVDHFAGYPAFTYRDVKLYLQGRKKSTKNLTRIISYLKSSGKIYTIRKGAYTCNRDDIVAGFAYSPFYYGLLAAMTMRELWTQNAKPDILTLRRIRNSKVSIFDDPDDVIFLHHIPAKYFFGYDVVKYGNIKVPVSDEEKTLIDLFYYKVRLSIQSYSGLLRSIDVKKLAGYLRRYDRRTAKVVMNFVKRYKQLADAGKLESPY